MTHLLHQLGGANFWWGIEGQSVFDRYSPIHAFIFVWLTLVLTLALRRPPYIVAALIICIIGWETFEAVFLGRLHIEPFGGTETVRNRFLGDSISDALGFLTYQAAVWSARRRVPSPKSAARSVT